METSEPGPVPDFVGIGALKAGTSFLDGLLRSHAELAFPAYVKELDYFSRRYDNGPQWYAEQFPPPDGRLRGESSPNYISWPEAPDRVHRANPGARLLVVLRHPVDRAVSQYRHFCQTSGYSADFATFTREHPTVLDRSHYASQLAPWLDLFGAEQIRLMVFEDLIADPTPVVQGLLGWLGVSPQWRAPELALSSNTTLAPRFPRVYAAAKRMSRRLYYSDHGRLVQTVKRTPGFALIASGSSRPAPDVSAQARLAMAEEFAPEVAWVGSYLGRDLTGLWGSVSASAQPS